MIDSLIANRVGQLISQNAVNILNMYNTIGAALAEGQQEFVMANWKNLQGFLKTKEGEIALQTFISDWQASLKP